MTMRLTIKNEDQSRTAQYVVEDRDVNTGAINTADSQHLAPGESREVWIHASRRVVLTEDAMASRPVSPNPE